MIEMGDEENIGLAYVTRGCAFVILPIQLLRALRNSRFWNNTTRSWQVNTIHAA